MPRNSGCTSASPAGNNSLAHLSACSFDWSQSDWQRAAEALEALAETLVDAHGDLVEGLSKDAIHRVWGKKEAQQAIVKVYSFALRLLPACEEGLIEAVSRSGLAAADLIFGLLMPGTRFLTAHSRGEQTLSIGNKELFVGISIRVASACVAGDSVQCLTQVLAHPRLDLLRARLCWQFTTARLLEALILFATASSHADAAVWRGTSSSAGDAALAKTLGRDVVQVIQQSNVLEYLSRGLMLNVPEACGDPSGAASTASSHRHRRPLHGPDDGKDVDRGLYNQTARAIVLVLQTHYIARADKRVVAATARTREPYGVNVQYLLASQLLTQVVAAERCVEMGRHGGSSAHGGAGGSAGGDCDGAGGSKEGTDGGASITSSRQGVGSHVGTALGNTAGDGDGLVGDIGLYGLDPAQLPPPWFSRICGGCGRPFCRGRVMVLEQGLLALQLWKDGLRGLPPAPGSPPALLGPRATYKLCVRLAATATATLREVYGRRPGLVAGQQPQRQASTEPAGGGGDAASKAATGDSGAVPGPRAADSASGSRPLTQKQKRQAQQQQMRQANRQQQQPVRKQPQPPPPLQQQELCRQCGRGGHHGRGVDATGAGAAPPVAYVDGTFWARDCSALAMDALHVAAVGWGRRRSRAQAPDAPPSATTAATGGATAAAAAQHPCEARSAAGVGSGLAADGGDGVSATRDGEGGGPSDVCAGPGGEDDELSIGASGTGEDGGRPDGPMVDALPNEKEKCPAGPGAKEASSAAAAAALTAGPPEAEPAAPADEAPAAAVAASAAAVPLIEPPEPVPLPLEWWEAAVQALWAAAHQPVGLVQALQVGSLMSLLNSALLAGSALNPDSNARHSSGTGGRAAARSPYYSPAGASTAACGDGAAGLTGGTTAGCPSSPSSASLRARFLDANMPVALPLGLVPCLEALVRRGVPTVAAAREGGCRLWALLCHWSVIEPVLQRADPRVALAMVVSMGKAILHLDTVGFDESVFIELIPSQLVGTREMEIMSGPFSSFLPSSSSSSSSFPPSSSSSSCVRTQREALLQELLRRRSENLANIASIMQGLATASTRGPGATAGAPASSEPATRGPAASVGGSVGGEVLPQERYEAPGSSAAAAGGTWAEMKRGSAGGAAETQAAGPTRVAAPDGGSPDPQPPRPLLLLSMAAARWLPCIALLADQVRQLRPDECSAAIRVAVQVGCAAAVLRCVPVLCRAYLRAVERGAAAAEWRKLLLEDVDPFRLVDTAVAASLEAERMKAPSRGSVCSWTQPTILLACETAQMLSLVFPAEMARAQAPCSWQMLRSTGGSGGRVEGGAAAVDGSLKGALRTVQARRGMAVVDMQVMRVLEELLGLGLELPTDGKAPAQPPAAAIGLLLHSLLFASAAVGDCLVPPSALSAVLPVCANPRCANLAGDSEAELPLPVSCGACGGAVRYCSDGCRAVHARRGHSKAVCAALKAAACAAAGAGVGAAAGAGVGAAAGMDAGC